MEEQKTNDLLQTLSDNAVRERQDAERRHQETLQAQEARHKAEAAAAAKHYQEEREELLKPLGSLQIVTGIDEDTRPPATNASAQVRFNKISTRFKRVPTATFNPKDRNIKEWIRGLFYIAEDIGRDVGVKMENLTDAQRVQIV